MTEKFDLTVVGSGPGGYVAAIRASQLGMKVLMIEKEDLGGVCLNWGCIPTKALLESAHLLNSMQNSKEFGLECSEVKPNMPEIIERSRKVASKMSNGVNFLMKKNNITVKFGKAEIINPKTVRITGKENTEVETDWIILAIGGRPKEFPGLPFDHEMILSSKSAMIQKTVPKTLAIIGAGAIGVEFSDFYQSLGTNVHLIEAMDQILPIEDTEISKILRTQFEKRGINVYTSTLVEKVNKNGQKLELFLKNVDGSKKLEVDKLISAIGVIPNTDSMDLEKIGVLLKKGFVQVDSKYKTTVDNIYAIGDCNGPPLLAHVASHEGIKAAEAISIRNGNPKKLTYHSINYNHIPSCTYCHPEVASLGFTEKKLKELGTAYKIGKFPMNANGRASAMGENTGLIKILTDEKTEEILGAHLIGPMVTEILSEISLGMSSELTVEQFIESIHAHPTVHESIVDAILDTKKESINF